MLVTVTVLVVGLALSALAHELTHVAAARTLGAESAALKWFRRGDSWLTLTLVVDYDFGEPVGSWRHRAVGLAPLACGVAIAAGVLVLNGLPDPTPGVIVAGACWAMYTVTGGLEDYRVGF